MFTVIVECFKPCYKWNTFNTMVKDKSVSLNQKVLNLVISGIPSIQNWIQRSIWGHQKRFKPCYKWNTFNTYPKVAKVKSLLSFKPCYKWNTFNTLRQHFKEAKNFEF